MRVRVRVRLVDVTREATELSHARRKHLLQQRVLIDETRVLDQGVRPTCGGRSKLGGRRMQCEEKQENVGLGTGARTHGRRDQRPRNCHGRQCSSESVHVCGWVFFGVLALCGSNGNLARIVVVILEAHVVTISFARRARARAHTHTHTELSVLFRVNIPS